MKWFAGPTLWVVLLIAGVALFCKLPYLSSRRLNRSRQSMAGSRAGGSGNNSRSQASETKISISNVNKLSPLWTFTTGADVSATPTVDEASVYFPDWSGNLYAVDRNTGALKWSHQISDYDGQQGAFSRVSPAVHADAIIFGDILSATEPHDGADVMAVTRASGELRWIAKVDNNAGAVITGSPVVVGDVVYVGVSSIERESLATNPDYPCCSFRGSVVALDANSGRILWKRYMTPDNFGSTDQYSGNAVWQPPAIDLTRGLLYIGTGK